MSNSKLAIMAAIAVAGLVLLIWVAGGPGEGEPDTAAIETAPPPPPVSETAPEPEPAVEPEPAPDPTPEVVREAPAPEPAQPEPEPEPPLPTLNDSDGFVREQVAGLAAGDALLRLLADDEILRKFVILAENASRGILPQRELPVQPMDQPLDVRVVDEASQTYVMEPSSYERFDPLVSAFMGAQTTQAMSLYERLKPLLQEAYEELGYRGRDFDAVLVQAIDNVLEADVPAQGPYRLTRPSVMYEFEDARLENLSPVEKLLLRVGPENRRQLQEKLRAFRDAM